MRPVWMVQRVSLLVLFPLIARGNARGDTAAPNAKAKYPPVIAVWDTRQTSAQALSPAGLLAQDGWTRIPTKTTTASLQGDVVLSNGRILTVVRKEGSAAEIYALGGNHLTARLRLQFLAAGGEPGVRLERVSVVENTKAAACVEMVYSTTRGIDLGARLRLKRGEVSIQAEPGPQADRLRVECPGRFVVLPDFFADDILIDAKSIPPDRIELPSENFLLHLAAKGDAIATCVFENRKQDVVITLAGTSEQRTITASDIPFETKKVWVAVLEGPGMWHTMDVKPADAGIITPLGWQMPFPAHWRVDLTNANALTDSWDMLLQAQEGYVKPSMLGGGENHLPPNRRRWNTVLGSYPYPCWADQEGKGYLQPLKNKPLQFQGPAVVYPINRVKQTPLDAYTVVDVMRNTLGVGPCEHILDLEGQKGEYKGRATCSVRDELGRIYGSKQQKQKHAEVETILDDGLIFVTHIRGRITRYIEFGHKMHQYLAEQKKTRPELIAFLDEMDQITQQIDARVAARADKIHTPAHVAGMNEEFRKTVLDYDGPDALQRCRKYSTALVEIGDNQDELSGECRWVVKNLRQRAGLLMARDPRVAPIATEIRNRTQEALRNPANHEGAQH